MMKLKSMSAAILLLSIQNAMALNVGDITTFMPTANNQVSKEIANATTEGRFISIRVVRLSSPLEGATVIPMEKRDEMLFTPSSLLMPANSTEIVRFIYNGPVDDQERYYRIIWTDQSMSELPQSHAKRKALATASAHIGTLLIVTPRKSSYSHTLEDRAIKNTGNASFKTIAYGPCLVAGTAEQCKENYYVMPGRKREFKHVDVLNKKSRVAVWQEEDFVSVK